MIPRLTFSAMIVATLALATGVACADVLNMPAGQTSVTMVAVGDLGNAAEPVYTGWGAVAYNYKIDEYDVTAAQYCQFLDAKAATDPYSLWNSGMSTDASGGIGRSGSDGSYTYTVKTGHDNNPAIYITWFDALRFANWLNNGQGDGATETGTYTITGSGPNWTITKPSVADRTNFANSYGLHWVVPNANELYKAQYYKGGGTSSGYWHYGTASDTAPTSTGPTSTPNTANVYGGSAGGFALTHSVNQDPSLNYLTDVGAYPNSRSAYGLYDVEGPVTQFCDTYSGTSHYAYGGNWWYYGATMMGYNMGALVMTSDPQCYLGFRVECVGLGYMPGDANGDAKVDINDLSKVLTNYDQSGKSWADGDFNGDGAVDITDLSVVLTNYDKTFSASSLAAVPEPGALALLAAGLAGLIVYAWRRR